MSQSYARNTNPRPMKGAVGHKRSGELDVRRAAARARAEAARRRRYEKAKKYDGLVLIGLIVMIVLCWLGAALAMLSL